MAAPNVPLSDLDQPVKESSSRLARWINSWKFWTLALILAVAAIALSLSIPLVRRWQSIEYFDSLESRVHAIRFAEGHEERVIRYGRRSLVFHEIDEVTSRKATDEILRHVGSLRDTRGLILGQSQPNVVTERGLAYLQGFDQLEELLLTGPAFTDEAIARLIECRPPLTYVSLKNTGASEQTLARLATIPSIENLTIEGAGITDEMFDGLSALPALKKVNISGAGDNTADWLTHSPDLAGIELRESTLTDAGAQQLLDLHGVRMLVVVGAPITSAGLRHLTEFNSHPYEFLGIVNCPHIVPADIVRLPDMPTLKGLCLSNDLLTLESIHRLRELPHLKHLFSDGQIEDEQLRNEATIGGRYHVIDSTRAPIVDFYHATER